MADNISYIHTNKLAKYNYKYLSKDGTVYIGQKDGRLKKQEVTVTPDGLDVTLSWGNISGDILNQTDLTAYVTNLIAAITLDDLADVTITAPAPGDVLIYDAINNIWINGPGGGGGGVTTFSGGTTGLTPVAPTAGAVTLGGTLAITNGGTGLTALGTGLQYLRVNAGATALEYATFPAIPVVTPSALSRVNDTNVTLTLGGTPATALLQAVSLTLGWTGTLAVSRGGTGLGTTPTNGQLLIGNGTGYTLSTLTAGAGISITNAPGSITVSNTSPASSVTITGRQGDVIVSGASPTFQVSTVVSPFLLMGG